MKFDWDDTKNRINQKKHGVWFEEAQTVWADEYSIEFFDPEHSEGEDRFIRIGLSSRSNLLIVVFCERDHGDVVRIISARKATDKEKKSYEEGI
ncbi:MAG: BrnT family toxin [Bdellovibrionales bacterium]|nr:BrnT family toxin [Bdellovibrionales bacterium]